MPCRPNPIGLSIARIISVERGCLVVGGADIVDGSPVLDVKPYLRFCDSCPDATAPQWVQVSRQPSSTNTSPDI
jgi:tRNA (Thr-GGU) A37 N-methylase